jgi:phosphate transport system permease protein
VSTSAAPSAARTASVLRVKISPLVFWFTSRRACPRSFLAWEERWWRTGDNLVNGGSRSRKPEYARGAVSAVPTTSPLQARRHRLRGRLGDLVLHGLTLAAALACLVLVGAIVWKIFELAGPAFDQFGFGFVTGRTWDPVKHVFGALPFIYGTAVTSLVAVVLATPLAIAIGLYLSELAPRGLRGIVGSLVELLAAIPSVVLGLWGILVLGPFLAHHVEPWLHSTLGFIPLFGDPQQTGQGLFTAAVILTIMIVPIVASISRELFLGVPRELEEGALALGATRWEMVRGVILPATRSGVGAAVILGLGRALGEAIAVTQVIGGGTRISWSLFPPADTLASKIASSYQGAGSGLEISSLMYLAAILLVLGLIANLAAQVIVRRFDPLRGARS